MCRRPFSVSIFWAFIMAQQLQPQDACLSGWGHDKAFLPPAHSPAQIERRAAAVGVACGGYARLIQHISSAFSLNSAVMSFSWQVHATHCITYTHHPHIKRQSAQPVSA